VRAVQRSHQHRVPGQPDAASALAHHSPLSNGPALGGPIWPEEIEHRLTTADEDALKDVLRQMLAD